MMTYATSEDDNQEHRLPRGVTIRPGVADDEFATFDVMRRSMGYEMSWAHHSVERSHLHSTEHASYWVAEELPRFGSPRVIGYARSVVRDGVWCLTEFFVLPGQHRKGIGTTLLAKCLADGADAHTRMVLASHHPGADALYIRKLGCLPRVPMLLLAGPLERLRLPDAESGRVLDADYPGLTPTSTVPCLRAEPLILTPQTAAALADLDRAALGYSRSPEHALWSRLMGGPDGAARIFRRVEPGARASSGPIVGYGYIGPYSSGPALAQNPNELLMMVQHISTLYLRLSPDTASGIFAAPDQYLAVPGVNGAVLRWLLACGWKIVFQYLYMSSSPPGDLERYVCHNPLYFL